MKPSNLKSTFSLRKIILFLVLLVILIVVILFLFRNSIMIYLFKPRSSSVRTGLVLEEVMKKEPVELSQKPEKPQPSVQVILENLNIPWELVFLPDQTMLITERPGFLVRVLADKTLVRMPVGNITHKGEAGLLGLALDPNFSQNNYIYLYETTTDGSGLKNSVNRYKLDLINNKLTEKMAIIDNIKGALYHDGGRIIFGKDGYLYVTTGDAGTPDLAQDINALEGKILRIIPDGKSKVEVFSMGHRNPQGLAFDELGQLWSTEHGPSGAQTGYDEVNFIDKGANYGWPKFKGSAADDEFYPAILDSGTNDTWAPSGMTIIDEKLFFVGLRGEAIYTALIRGAYLDGFTEHFKSDFGRLRTVVDGKDGYIYILTNNTDGRGEARPNDDRLIKIKLDLL